MLMLTVCDDEFLCMRGRQIVAGGVEAVEETRKDDRFRMIVPMGEAYFDIFREGLEEVTI